MISKRDRIYIVYGFGDPIYYRSYEEAKKDFLSMVEPDMYEKIVYEKEEPFDKNCWSDVLYIIQIYNNRFHRCSEYRIEYSTFRKVEL